MSTSLALVLGVGVLVVLAAVALVTTTARKDRATVGRLTRETQKRDRAERGKGAISGQEVEAAARAGRDPGREVVLAPTAAPAPAAPYVVDEDAIDVTRRQFLNRSILGMFGLGVSAFGAASIGFLWPTLAGGSFGAKIRAGKVDDILSRIRDTREPVYIAEGRMYIAPFPQEDIGKAEAVYSGGVLDGMKAGVVALYQKCPHLGCRVPWCASSQWFECPCHGSQYNRVGEKKAGPAPRGMDRFPVSVEGGIVTVDTGQIVQGPVIGVNTTGQEAEGPHCA